MIDGNNVFGSRPDGWWRDRAGAAQRLAHRVDRWQAVVGEPVTLVFDGAAVGAISALERDGLAVRFAPGPGPDAADRWIVADVEGPSTATPEVVVVTADRGLIVALPPGVAVEGPATFLARLDEAGV